MNTIHFTPNRARNFHYRRYAEFFNASLYAIYTVSILSGILPSFIWNALLLNWNLSRFNWNILEFTEALAPLSACIRSKSA